jgi:hypothetical protein
MSTSAWGVEHGSEISKLDEKKYAARQGALGAVGLGWAGAAASSKKGRKFRNAGRSWGSEVAYGTGGGVAGVLAGAATKNPKVSQVATRAGGLAGGIYGAHRAGVNAHRRGDIKSS